MRVVHVVTAWPRSEEDPITPWLVSLLSRLRERGVEAEVLAPAWRGGPPSGPGPRGIPVQRFRYAPSRFERLTHEETVPDRLGRRPLWSLLLPGYLAGGLAAARRIGRSVPDVVHVHWPMPHALFGAAARRASGGRTALVCSFYSVELRWVERRLRPLAPLLRWSARTADEVTAISRATAERLRAVSGREARVIPFAAALEAGGFEAGGSEESAREDAAHAAGGPAVGGGAAGARLPLAASGPLRLLFVGRLVERKGVEILVRALARIRAARPAALTVVGEGEWRDRILRTAREAGVEKHVRLTGFVSEEDLRGFYRECDVFVLPAVVDRKGDTEGLGVVLLEALRFGRPVVASEVGGIPDIVVPGRSGWLVPPGDPTVLADRILALAANPEEARAVAERGRAWAAERFSWERIVDEVLACYAAARGRRT